MYTAAGQRASAAVRAGTVWTGALFVALVLTACSSDDPVAAPDRAGPSPSAGSSAPVGPAPPVSPQAGSPAASGSPQAGTTRSSPSAAAASPPGSLDTVPARPVQRRSPVPLTSPAPVGDGAVVRLAGTRPVTTGGKGPGESSGEAATAFTVEVVNGRSQPLELDTAVVDVATGAAATPGRPSAGPPAAPLSGTVAPGASARGTYVFVLPAGSRSAVTLTVSLAGGSPVVVLRGALP